MTKPYKCRVEYLESTGTQYIDTGLKGKNNIEFDYKCIFTNLDGTAQCVGGNWSGAGTSTVSLYLGLIRTNGNFAYHYDGTQSPVVVMNTTVQDTPYTVQGHMWVGEQYIVINGTKSSVGTISSTFTSSLNMYLFGINNNGLSNPAYIKLYYCKIYDNGTQVRDFIPVLDNSGRPAMYDQVSGQLFYNQGSGEFTYGRQIIPVEYLQSTGTQYINTGYAFADNFSWEIDFEGILDNTTLFGGRTSSARTALLYQRVEGGINVTTCPIAGLNGANTPFQLSDLRTGRHTVKMAVNANKGSVWVDGIQSYNEQSFTGTYISGTTQALFADNFGSSVSEYTSSKVYALKMWQGSTLVRDFIPCIDENLVPFMFDLITNTCYLNAGTGQFKVGPYKADNLNKKLMRKKLALMLANLKKKRKYYCEVEYIESTGTQWINAGINVNTSTDEIKLYFELTETQNYKWFFGEYDNNARLGLGSGDGANKRNFLYQQSATKVSDTQMYNTQHLFEINSNGGFLDGTKIRDYANFASTSNIYLFNLNIDSPSDYRCKSKIWKYEHKRNGVLVRDMIPVLDWNMTPCMYDKVTETLFYNAGSGDFTTGREIHYVDYLESTGTQYINTGVNLTNNHSVEIDYQLTNASQTRAGLFGSLNMSGSNQGRFGSLLSPSNKYLEHGYGSGNDYWQQGLPDTNRHKLYQKKNELYFDGSLIHSFSTATFSLVLNAPLGSFGYTNYTPAKSKYYSSRWWDGDTLIREYRPAIDENGVCFWFDRVSHTIYDNAGTDAFKYPVKETTYTANAGTPAYIDLGIKYKSSMSIRGKFTRDAMGNSGSVLLLSTSTTNPVLYFPALNANSAIDRYVWRRAGYSEQSYYLTFSSYPTTQEVVLDAINDTLTVNGNLVKSGMIAGMGGYTSPYQSNSNLYMFSITGTYAGNGKNYYLQIDDGTTPVLDLIPAYKDGQAGFYDKVNGVFYGNVSTNVDALLTAGKIVEPEYE